MTDSPAKKLSFEVAGKENVKEAGAMIDDIETKKPMVVEKTPEQKPAVAPTIKSEESDEPLLQENPHRFVLFPIKYHEVGLVLHATRHA